MAVAMFVFYHHTRLGNSFNIALAQEIFWHEFGVSSAYPNAENFWNLFDESCRRPFGYVGANTAEAEIARVQSVSERIFCKAMLSHPIDEAYIHNACTDDPERGYRRHEGEAISILSTDQHAYLDPRDIRPDRMTIMNRGHSFSMPDSAELKKKHQDRLREKLVIRGDLIDGQTDEFRSFLRAYDKVYAVHLRKTDFQTYLGGRFFYSDEQYAEFCEIIARHAGGTVGFVIFSDDEFNDSVFGDLPRMRNRGTAEIDIVAMSMCSGIIGPPSSFANCASFIGKVPRFVVRDVGQFKALYVSGEIVNGRRGFPWVA